MDALFASLQEPVVYSSDSEDDTPPARQSRPDIEPQGENGDLFARLRGATAAAGDSSDAKGGKDTPGKVQPLTDASAPSNNGLGGLPAALRQSVSTPSPVPKHHESAKGVLAMLSAPLPPGLGGGDGGTATPVAAFATVQSPAVGETKAAGILAAGRQDHHEVKFTGLTQNSQVDPAV